MERHRQSRVGKTREKRRRKPASGRGGLWRSRLDSLRSVLGAELQLPAGLRAPGAGCRAPTGAGPRRAPRLRSPGDLQPPPTTWRLSAAASAKRPCEAGDGQEPQPHRLRGSSRPAPRCGGEGGRLAVRAGARAPGAGAPLLLVTHGGKGTERGRCALSWDEREWANRSFRRPRGCLGIVVSLGRALSPARTLRGEPPREARLGTFSRGWQGGNE